MFRKIARPIALSFATGIVTFEIANQLKKSHQRNSLTLPKFQRPESFLKRLIQIPINEWNSLTSHKKAVYSLIAVNSLVFVAWQIPRFSKLMYTQFMHHDNHSRYIPMLTSAFSHNNLIHFGANMMVLSSFGPITSQLIGSPEDFVAFYVTSGVCSSAISEIITALLKRKVLPGLGASGALMSCIGVCSISMPFAPVGIMFLPFSFQLADLFTGLFVFDCVGVAMGWQIIGHSCHIGGALTGLYFAWNYLPQRRIQFKQWINKRL